MDLEKDDFRTVIEDARTRHTAVVALIYFTDRQAMSLLRMMVTLGIASASGAWAGLAEEALLPRPVGAALVAATACLTIGAGFCLAAMRSGEINLPGRAPDFWSWAIDNEGVTRSIALKAYLDALSQRLQTNRDFNASMAKALARAKYMAALTPAIALAVGYLAFSISF